MRDGVRLETRLFVPKGEGPFPVVLQRGYSAGFDRDGEYFASHGYVYVGQATRGHGASEGEGHRFFDDAEDGWDTLDWIAEAPWCDGNVAMYGKSYMAITQWLVAPLKHRALKASAPAGSGHCTTSLLSDLDREVSGREDRLWNGYISHSRYDEYWRAISMADGLDAVGRASHRARPLRAG